jgi:hypothetical protein
VVVYIGLTLEGASPGLRMHVRTLTDFMADVHTDDGSVCTDDCPREEEGLLAVRRFKYVGKHYLPAKEKQ